MISLASVFALMTATALALTITSEPPAVSPSNITSAEVVASTGSSDFEALAFGTVIVCTDANLQGNRATLGVDNAVCTCFTGALSSLNDKVSSMQFDLGAGATCDLYADNNCSGKTHRVANTAVINNFKDIGFNDQMTCFRCFRG